MPLSWNLGTLTSWNPLGHSRPVTGLLYLLLAGGRGCLTPRPGRPLPRKRHGGSQGRSGRVRKISLVRDSIPDSPTHSESLRYATPEKRGEGSKICLPKERSSIRFTIGSEATRFCSSVTNSLLWGWDLTAMWELTSIMKSQGQSDRPWRFTHHRWLGDFEFHTVSVTGSSTRFQRLWVQHCVGDC